MSAQERSALRLAAVLAGAGVLHLARPGIYEPLIPRRLGSARAWVIGSGVAELACAAALVPERTRAAGGAATAGLFLAVFPGNVQMAYDWRRRPWPWRAVAYARLPLQVPLLRWALRIARTG